MGKYYSSSEETWNKETTAQEKIADGISKLYQINNALDRGFDELKSDKYGLMSNNSYDNFSYQIVQCGEKNHALSQYSKEIHGILKDKEISFCKGVSKVIEEMSLLEITEYTTENTLGITERKNVPTAYYNGSMAYQAGMPISYQVKDVPKGKINILDIQMKTDIMGIEEQLEAYLKEEKGNLTDAELVELKEEYYQQYLQTSFEHEVYTDGWLKNLSTTLDYIPIVGGVKNAIEGLCGYTMTGEKLTTQERISYTALGILTTAVDVFTLGTASGLIQGGKFVGKELAKSGIKKLGKYAIMDSVSSVTMGWGSQFAGEKLRDFGLSAEGIFAIHLIASVSTVGVSKLTKEKVIDSKTFTNWSDMKNANKGTVTKLVDEYKPNGATHPRKWLAVDGTSLTIDTVKRPFGSTYQIWHYTDSTGVVTSGIKGIDDITLGQIHHYASNKNKEYTNQFKEILEIYGLDLDDDWNKRYISSHIGSHPKEYHEFVLEQLNKADRLAKGNVEKFKRYYEKLVIDKVNKNPEMLNKSYWRNK